MSRARTGKPSGWIRQCVDDLLRHIDSIELKIAEYDRILAKIAEQDVCSSKSIMKQCPVVPGIAELW
ncbi:hypothetical protein PSI19_08715 [Xenorhabdus khoisanae]|uniref:hypothetical protein n=1 Tax=Xenorhabdus khoisanae TaxID=880157 RepID=UPI0023586FF1|nr:hypothetical protein [Xenorhabdus khoisanae]MDC9613953.1 hypothetical protein [Xenorhabdus khoisanae]